MPGVKMSSILSGAARYFPVLDWGRRYDRQALSADLLAAVIVTIMLIPQSLAYAMLAGLPPVTGLYASILPLILYALFGTSRALAVGPVAVIALMTAAAAGPVAARTGLPPAAVALTLALLSGLMLVAMGLLRLGFLASFLSHPVIGGFITASGILIATSQLRHLLGIEAGGDTLPEMIATLAAHLGAIHWPTVAVGLGALAFLVWSRRSLRPLLIRFGLGSGAAGMMARTGPVLAVAATTTAAWGLDLASHGVRLVGEVPQGLPPLTMPPLSLELLGALAVPALLISIIGFVESVSVAQTLAAKKRQRIRPDQELVALGAANLGAAFTGGMPVTGGFARSVVNFDAGAETPAAGAFTALGLAVASLTLTPLIAWLPQATLAATIIVAVLSLVDFGLLRRAWTYSKADFAAVAATIVATLGFGVETGVTAGVILSLVLHLFKTARPHIAEVGLVPGTQHFRNIRRHAVLTDPAVLQVRIDQSLTFFNARALEDWILNRIAGSPVRHVVLMASAINEIDFSALETLESLDHRLREAGIALHLAEVKGPVMDRLAGTPFLRDLSGRVFLSQYEALQTLSPATTAARVEAAE
ncbi:high affinity sulfate transporter 1 [Rubellimicrobium thermophilum DSM 16684]|uniref:High affinity sulfate transporter 1 n=1 Tax=Rubellimicrobium thermophilum DSM 16684 TaxID=1123069 RepID=S9S396_9RHOB|nr:sulfate permease [Rubellimicrobium thermophilum]EPX84660.1 high affinity sulfate transporter 1 [Rubellimicrobium thermophilum DSM 16684]